MKHERCIANVSGGKDSLAQLMLILDGRYPLDEVVFYDTGMEFDAIYRIFDCLKTILADRNIPLTVLKPQNPFLYDMLDRPVESKEKGKHNGYGWCGGVCRWGTTWKTQALDRYAGGAVQYIGIAADEQHRRRELTGKKRSILIERGITEAECLKICRDSGWHWREVTSEAENGYVDLYDILDRVSCWCCANKNIRELWNMWKYLPAYWNGLKFLQSRIVRPMKKYTCKQYGEYGDIFRLEEIFKAEAAEPTAFTRRYLTKKEAAE